MNESKCSLGHSALHWNSKGERKGPRCPMCLALPIRDAFIGLTSDRESQLMGLARALYSVTRCNVGQKMDAEAMQLALGRDREWRNRQLVVMRAIQKALMVAKFDQKITFIEKIQKGDGNLKITVNHNMEWRPFANLLIDVGIMEVSSLLLKIRIPNPTDEVDCIGDPWDAVYYYCLDIMSSIMLTSHWENPKAKKFIRKIAASDFVDTVMAFVDDSPHFLAMVMSIYVLCHVYTDYPNVGLKLVQAGLLSKLGTYLHKDNSVRIMNKWMNIGLFPYEMDVLMENQAGLLPMRSTSSFDLGEPLDYSDEDIKDIGIQFASTLQQSSLQCLGYLSKDKQVREFVTKDHIIGKAIGRWVRMPVLSPENRYMLEACLKVLSEMVHVSHFAWKLLDDYGFMSLLENGAFYPDKDVIWHYLEVATRIGMHRGPLLKRIAENSMIMRSAGIHMYSLEPNCHVYSIAILTLAVDNPGVENIIKYFGPKHFYYYPEYFFNKTPIIGIKISELQVGCKRFGKKIYDKADKEFSKTRHLILDATKATDLKEKGNQCYKKGQCLEAIGYYTQALNVCPPTKQDKRGPRRDKTQCLNATLLSNRAQCYLNLGEYDKAVEDCDEAIARCLGGTDEDDPTLPDAVRLKAMFRRSKALFELGKYFRAVQDVGECQINQPSEMFKAHLDKVMIRFRRIMGMDPVQRCDECRQTNGFKLKRCAHCMAIYCSKKCQEIAWVKRHKTNCQEYQAERATEEAAEKEGATAKRSIKTLDLD